MTSRRALWGGCGGDSWAPTGSRGPSIATVGRATRARVKRLGQVLSTKGTDLLAAYPAAVGPFSLVHSLLLTREQCTQETLALSAFQRLCRGGSRLIGAILFPFPCDCLSCRPWSLKETSSAGSWKRLLFLLRKRGIEA